MRRRKEYLVMAIALGIWFSLVAGAEEKKSSGSWTERIAPMVDFRYRHEEIDAEGGDWRTRERIRLRAGFKAKLIEDWDLIFQLASGTGEPVSTNQSLDGGFNQKQIWIDMAYLHYHPEAVKGLNVYGGRVKNPLFIPGKNQLIWDSDLNPEGWAIGYGKAFNRFSVFANCAGFWLDERSEHLDGIMYGAQVGTKIKLGENGKTHLNLGVGYYDFQNTKGYPIYYSKSGNSVDAANKYIHAYELTEGMVEFGFKVAEIPLLIFGDYVVNNGIDKSDPEEDNIGWAIGFNVGKADKKNSWAVRYLYRELQKDAVIGAFSDSDFGGGGTNNRGHIVGLDYSFSKNVVMSLTYFLNTTAISKDDPKELDYNRMQLDLSLKF